MLLLAGIVLAVAAAALVFSPLFNGDAAPLTDGPDQVAELRELYSLRDMTYETLRDLEFDLYAGKTEERDFHDLSNRFKGEALTLVERIDRIEAELSRSKSPGRPRS